MRPCLQHTLDRSTTLPTLLGLIRGMEVQTVTIACPLLWTSLSIPAQPPCSCDWRSSLPKRSFLAPASVSLWQAVDSHCVRSLEGSEHPAMVLLVALQKLCPAAPQLPPSPVRVAGQPEEKGTPGTRDRSRAVAAPELLQRFPTALELALNGLRVSRRQECGECSTGGRPLWGIKAHDSHAAPKAKPPESSCLLPKEVV